jgi:hypothetical protein
VSEDHPLHFDFISYEFGAWVYAYLINKVADSDVLLEIFSPKRWRIPMVRCICKSFQFLFRSVLP